MADVNRENATTSPAPTDPEVEAVQRVTRRCINATVYGFFAYAIYCVIKSSKSDIKESKLKAKILEQDIVLGQKKLLLEQQECLKKLGSLQRELNQRLFELDRELHLLKQSSLADLYTRLGENVLVIGKDPSMVQTIKMDLEAAGTLAVNDAAWLGKKPETIENKTDDKSTRLLGIPPSAFKQSGFASGKIFKWMANAVRRLPK